MMQVSLLLTIDDEQYLLSFLESILAQTQEIKELIVTYNSVNPPKLLLNFADKVPFPVHIISSTKRNDYQYIDAMKLATGDILLFAKSSHPMLPNKVFEFKRYLEQDPYFKYVFTNATVIDEHGATKIADYFGLIGFHEHWDYYKPMINVLLKQNGFVPAYLVATTANAQQRILKLFEDFPTLSPAINFSAFLALYNALLFDDCVKEIPYVLNAKRCSASAIKKLKTETRHRSVQIETQLNFLTEVKRIVPLIAPNHNAISNIEDAIHFNRERLLNKKGNTFEKLSFGLIHLLNGNYSKYTLKPFLELKNDIR